MPAGLQVFNANGTERMNTSKRVSRWVTSVDVSSSASGSFTNPVFTSGTPFGIFIPRTGGHNVRLYFSGNTLYWNKIVPSIQTTGSIVVFVY